MHIENSLVMIIFHACDIGYLQALSPSFISFSKFLYVCVFVVTTFKINLDLLFNVYFKLSQLLVSTKRVQSFQKFPWILEVVFQKLFVDKTLPTINKSKRQKRGNTKNEMEVFSRCVMIHIPCYPSLNIQVCRALLILYLLILPLQNS